MCSHSCAKTPRRSRCGSPCRAAAAPGCQYALGFDGEPQPGDEVADQHGVKVVVDRFSLPYLSGAEVDFVDGLMGQGFTVNNPNAVASCGCGSSFKAEGDEVAAPAGGCSTCSA